MKKTAKLIGGFFVSTGFYYTSPFWLYLNATVAALLKLYSGIIINDAKQCQCIPISQTDTAR